MKQNEQKKQLELLPDDTAAQIVGGSGSSTACPHGLRNVSYDYCLKCDCIERVGGYEEYGQSMYKCTRGAEGLIPLSPCCKTDISDHSL